MTVDVLHPTVSSYHSISCASALSPFTPKKDMGSDGISEIFDLKFLSDLAQKSLEKRHLPTTGGARSFPSKI